MKNPSFENLSNQTLSGLIELADSFEKESAASQRNLIAAQSPYSDTINEAISTYSELQLYCSLGLVEAEVTRLALIREIDPCLHISSKGKTNLDLMLAGNPPYAYNAEDGLIELHHIGQIPSAPFAELTHSEHMMYGNNKKLHSKDDRSWRNTPNVERLYDKERALYWQCRARGEIKRISSPTSANLVPLPTVPTPRAKEAVNVMAQLYAESTPDELRFFSDSAKMYAFLKEFGARSFSDFTNQLTIDAQKACIHCGSKQYQLYGTYIKKGEKIQRYLCNECGLTFSPIQKTIISESKLSFISWMLFVNCLCHGKSVEETAQICNISTKSVQNNRLRLFYALKLLDDKINLRGKIVIDETYFLVSFKGNHSEQKDFSMGRKPHKRGNDHHSPGLSKEHICVVCALDENDASVARIAGVGAPDHFRIERALNDCIEPENVECIYSDKEKAIKKYADVNGLPIVQALSPKRKDKNYDLSEGEAKRWIQKINAFHSRLKRFMQPFCGISSDMLYGYLCLFTWIDRNRKNDLIDAYKELFAIMLKPHLYKSREEIATMLCFRDVTKMSMVHPKSRIRNFPLAKAIYAKYAAGTPIAEIAQEYSRSCFSVRYIIGRMNRLGYGYKTEKEKRREAKQNQPFLILYPYSKIERNKQIYMEKRAWEGNSEDFYRIAAKKHGLAKQTIKNIISDVSRESPLEEHITVVRQFTYRNLYETYRIIYDSYVQAVNNGAKKGETVKKLAIQYGYTEANISRINKIMKNKQLHPDGKKKKLAKIETKERDKAIFADFLRWEGSKKDFCRWAKEKYRLNFFYIYHILQHLFIADPKRYEMTYRYPTKRKE